MKPTPETPLGRSILAGLHAKEVAALIATEATEVDDPICSICTWEQSHARHHDPKLYNYHPFAGGDNV